MSKLILFFYLVIFSTYGTVFSQDRFLINSKNEFSGKTYQSYLEKRTLVFYEYYDINGLKVAEEYLYTEDYPILTDLVKRRVYYKLDKKIKEERFYTPKYIQKNMLTKTILYFDRYSGKQVASENHFSKLYLGYNKILLKAGRRDRIEWYYPNNKKGISKKIFYYNTSGKEIRSIVYFTDDFARENGFFKKIITKGDGSGSYLRKRDEVWYYTDSFAEQNSDLMKKVIKYIYHPNQEIETRIYYFDSLNEELMYSAIDD